MPSETFSPNVPRILNINIDRLSTTLLFATTCLRCPRANGSESIATAFFFAFYLSKTHRVPVIVTNNHVVEHAERAIFRMHTQQRLADRTVPSVESVTITYEDFPSQIIRHPGGLDLCAVTLAPLIKRLAKDGIELFYQPLTESMIVPDSRLQELPAMQDVVMVGYPTGLYDKKNNLPLLRNGKTSSHAAIDFDGKPEGLIDLACYPGSSGSPVVILNEGTYWEKDVVSVGTRAILLGILSRGPQFSAKGRVAGSTIPDGSASIIESQIPMHLGYYIKAKELLVLKNAVFVQEGIDLPG
jgi:hypothetical protein